MIGKTTWAEKLLSGCATIRLDNFSHPILAMIAKGKSEKV
jgi:hypothetical protein